MSNRCQCGICALCKLRARNAELEATLKRCLFDFRSTCMIMEPDARSMALELIREYTEVLEAKNA